MASRPIQPSSHSPHAAARRRVPLWLPAAVLVVFIVILGGTGVFLSRENAGRGQGTGHSASGVVGRWLRPDGDYVLAIRSVGPDGNADAGYFNPRSINVSKAQVKREGESTRVFIELRDTGYEGSSYDLALDPKTDRLVGTYHKRGGGSSDDFEVAFVRMK